MKPIIIMFDPEIYTQTYRFDSDDNILNSFNQIFKEYK